MRRRFRTEAPDNSYAWFATRQAGHVARRQLLAAGVQSSAIDRRLRNGYLIAVHPGVYLVAHEAPAECAREYAATLACGPGAVISHRSAARVYGLTSYPAVGVIWLTSTSERGAGTRGIRLVRTRNLEEKDVQFENWLPVTSPARTLLDIAALEDAEKLEATVAAAQVRRLVTKEELWEELMDARGRRGAAALRALMERHTPPAETRSVAERLMLRLIRRSGLPEPRTNVWLGRWSPDFYWPEHSLVAEYDSYDFHTDIGAFRRDREKSNDLQLRGIVVLRFTWHELTREPQALVNRLRIALGLADSATLRI
jgi:predicted transcriptional regulator of viral defense system